MKIEVWIRNPKNISWITDCNADVIGFGDEGCALKVSSNSSFLETVMNLTKESKKEFRLITPKVSEKRFKDIYDIISIVNKSIPDHHLTVNDFGILNKCNNSDMTFHSISIGRGISRSFEDCPWWEEYLDVEEENSRNLVIQSNMSNKQKLKNFKKLNVNAIETNYLKNQSSAYKNIRNSNFNVGVHCSPGVLAIARACQTARHYSAPVPNCTEKCNKKLELKFSEIYDFAEYYPACDKLKGLNSDLSVIGNMVYSSTDTTLDNKNINGANSIILHDYQFDSVDQLNKFMEEARSSVND